jgi:uncharacterized membrane protein YhhN
MFYLKQSGLDSKVKKLTLFALIFSSMGDALLIFPEMFLFGLGSFFIAQIFYSTAFSTQGKLFLVRAIPFYLVGIGLFIYLFPSLKSDLIIPIIVYVIMLTTMGWRASARIVSKEAYLSTLIGAIFFLLSDSLIAFTKFAGLNIPNPQVWIMVTYYTAQFLIIRGVRLSVISTSK